MSEETEYCKNAKSDMTPCYKRDGNSALANDGTCVGCGYNPKSPEPQESN